MLLDVHQTTVVNLEVDAVQLLKQLKLQQIFALHGEIVLILLQNQILKTIIQKWEEVKIPVLQQLHTSLTKVSVHTLVTYSHVQLNIQQPKQLKPL